MEDGQAGSVIIVMREEHGRVRRKREMVMEAKIAVKGAINAKRK